MADERDNQILQAAVEVFGRYGFRRTTMGDLAQAAGISRPALYLRYCSKEKVFEGAVQFFNDRILDEIREGIPSCGNPRDKLMLIMELWVFRPFEKIWSMPDAQEDMDACLTFARERIRACSGAFEAEIAKVLEEAVGKARFPMADPAELARLLGAVIHGFRATLTSPEELRELLGHQAQLVLSVLGYQPGESTMKGDQ
nr:TetR/AcrR family transcriptional regulator [uncultured Holophaga sp.]